MSEAKQKKVTRVRNEAETFVKVWQESENVAEVAAKLGITKNSAAARATKFRTQHKIPLKNMARGGGRRLDLDKLRSLVSAS